LSYGPCVKQFLSKSITINSNAQNSTNAAKINYIYLQMPKNSITSLYRINASQGKDPVAVDGACVFLTFVNSIKHVQARQKTGKGNDSE